MPPCLTQHYKVQIKGKVEQFRERSSAPSYTLCSSYRKGSLRVTLDYSRHLYFAYITNNSIKHQSFVYIQLNGPRVLFLRTDSSVQYVLREWFVRWEVSGHTTFVLCNAASRTCSKQHISLCNSHLAFLFWVFH